jgi:hypothetical protein
LGLQPIYRSDDPSSPTTPPSGLNAEGDGHAAIWKQQAGGSPIEIEANNCIFYVPTSPYTGDPDFPVALNSRNARSSFLNCKLVWTGPGSYPGTLPSTGVTVTSDVSVWNNAVQQWKDRHGVIDMDNVNTDKMINPDPWTSWS